MPSITAKRRVVVVGGSFAGLCTARHLKNDADVVVIEPRDYFEYTPGACHLMAGSGAYSALLSPMEQVCDGVRHECGWFAGLSSTTQGRLLVRRAGVEGKPDDAPLEELDFDALVICAGVPYTAPIRASPAAQTCTERIAELKAFNRRVEQCQNIVVVGGGLVGVELAAELAVRPNYKRGAPVVTLISRGNLLNTLPDKAGVHAMNWMRKNSVNVLIGDQVKDHNKQDKMLLTQRGVEIPVDLLVDCTGQGAVPSFQPEFMEKQGIVSSLSTSGGPAVVWPFSEEGLVIVDKHLRAVQFPDQGIFAAGDVVEHEQGIGFAVTTAKCGGMGTLSRRPTVRNAHIAESQAELCAANVRRFLHNTAAGKTSSITAHHLLQYPRDVFGAPLNPLLACVSLGPRQAILVVNGLVIGGAVLGLVAAIAKFVIERSKIAEIRQKAWGRAFWALSHVIVNALHAAYVNLIVFWKRLIFRKRGGMSAASSAGNLAPL